MWKNNTFKKIDINSSSIKEFINISNNLSEQKEIIFDCFEVTNHNVFKEVPIKNNKLQTFIREFLLSPDIVYLVPELNIENSLKEHFCFKEINPLIFDGDIAVRILLGGAYHDFPGTPDDAKKLGQELSKEIIGERYSDISVFTTDDSFTDWYFGVAWDTTWLILDKGQNKIWLICMTDSD